MVNDGGGGAPRDPEIGEAGDDAGDDSGDTAGDDSGDTADGVALLERRIAELTADLARANQQLERFAHVASHDLKEPLRAVSGFARLLDQRYADVLDDSGRTYLAFILDGADRLAGMIDALLDYSRTARRRMTVEDVDLASVTTAVVEDLAGDGRGVDADIHVGPLPTVPADAVLVRTILRHLLDNALLYTTADQPASVSVTAEDGSEGRVVLVVRDQGIGIAAEDHQRVFDLFTRLHTREDYPGHGIGLGLVAMAVQRLGGTIDLDSSPETGTTMRVALPTTHPGSSPSSAETRKR